MNQNAKRWLAKFEAELKSKYGITVNDTGWDGAELHERYGDTDPSLAVDHFGEKYGLHSITKF